MPLCYGVPSVLLPSVLWCCWLGGRKGIRPVKKLEWWGAGMVICLERGAGLHMAQLMPLPLTVSCFSKIHIGFTFLVPPHLSNPWQRAVKRVCVCYDNWFLLASTCARRRGVSGVLHMNKVNTSGPVSTWMGDRLQAGIPSWYVTSQLGQLSLSPLWGC